MTASQLTLASGQHGLPSRRLPPIVPSMPERGAKTSSGTERKLQACPAGIKLTVLRRQAGSRSSILKPLKGMLVPGRHVAKVIMPPTRDRLRPVDLWLCRRH
jgi:hypothetical protein